MSKTLRPRQYETVRACKGEDFKECFRCKKIKDVIEFNTYLYQPMKEGVPNGPKERKRLTCCKDCSRKRKKDETPQSQEEKKSEE